MRETATRTALRWYASLGVVCVCGAAGACTSERITSVTTDELEVSPPAVSTVPGELVRFSATLRDEGMRSFSSLPVRWSSDDESVVTVDQAGNALAIAPGSARVSAAFNDARGSALVRVIELPSPPPPDDPGSDGGGEGTGSGLDVGETDGGTVVSEGAPGNVDTLLVALTRRPASDVVVAVISGDPTELIVLPGSLRFTPAEWSEPQAVLLTGVDDLLTDGDQETLVTLLVEPFLSDADFAGVERSVTVTTLDDDDALPLAPAP